MYQTQVKGLLSVHPTGKVVRNQVLRADIQIHLLVQWVLEQVHQLILMVWVECQIIRQFLHELLRWRCQVLTILHK